MVAAFAGDVVGFLKHLAAVVAQIGFTATHMWQLLQCGIQWPLHIGRIDVQFLEDETHDGIPFGDDGLEQMFGLNSLVASSASQLYRFLDNFLRFDSKIVEIHIVVSPFIR